MATAGLPAPQDPCLNRTVLANVLTPDGTQVRSLVAANFRATLRGQPVDIESGGYNIGDRRVVVLLDVSASMVSDRSKLEASTTFSGNLLSSTPLLVSFALLTFTDRVEDEVNFGQGRRAVSDELAKVDTTNWERVKRDHKTAWLDTVLEALRRLEPPRRGDAICLITDGVDNASNTHPTQVRKALLRSGVRLFGLLIADPSFPGRDLVQEGFGFPEDLRGLVVDSGGSIMTLTYPDPTAPRRPWSQAMLSYARQLGVEISEFYELNLTLPGPLSKPREWKLEVVDSKVNKHLQIVYPRQLASCN